MGFFSQLGDIWAPTSRNYGLGRSWDLLGDAWGKTSSSVKSVAAGLWNISTAPFDNKKDFATEFMKFQGSLNNLVNQTAYAGLDVIGAAGELPGVKQAIGTAGFLQNEFVKRPLGAGYLMTGDVARGKASFFDTDKWRQAYDDTRYVTTGQAAVYSATGSSFPWVDPKGDLDPRSKAGQDAYHNNLGLKYLSGGVDAGVDMFADPTVYGGKGLALLKLKYISRPLKTAAEAEKFTNTTKYAKLQKFIQAAPNPEVVRQRVFNAHRGGDTAAALLWDVRNEPDLYDATFNALYGDRQSWDYLTEQAPRIAQVTGRTYANQTLAKASNLAGQVDEADNIVNSLRETESQAFVDAIANGRGAWGEGRGVLVGQHAPRVSVTSTWRAGVHNWATFGPAVFRGSPFYSVASRVRYLLPSAKFTRLMDLNDVESVHNFRSNLERSPLDRAQLENYVSQYGRATSPESRARIASNAEDDVFSLLAQKHGWTKEQAEAALPAINRWRLGNRKVFSTSRRFLSKDAMDLYRKYVDNGRDAEADASFFLSGDIDDAVARGDQPVEHYHMLDEDGNNILIPGRFEIDPQKPVALSQTPDIMAMQDWRALDTALFWARKGPVGVKSYQMLNMGQSLLDIVNQAWKITALLRPGYTWRMLSDDVMRRGSLYGSGSVLMSTSRGLKNAATNWSSRGGLVMDAVWRDRRRRGLGAAETVDGAVVDTGTRYASMHRQPLGGPYEPDADVLALSSAPDSKLRAAIEATAGRMEWSKADLRRELGIGDKAANDLIAELRRRGLIDDGTQKGRATYRNSTIDPQDLGLVYEPMDYTTYDRAMADGVMGVDDYLSMVDRHAERGDLPADVAMERQGLSDGTSTAREYRRHVIDRSLKSVGRGAYTDPAWQQEFIDAVVNGHLTKRRGQTGVATVIDPMSGMSPAKDVQIQPHDFTLSDTTEVNPHIDNLYDYIHDHIDELLMPRNILHAYVSPNGKLALSVARHDGVATAPVKQTGGVRVKLGKREGKELAQSGNDRITVNTPSGTFNFAAAFEGAEGNRFLAQASSRGPQDAWVEQLANTEYARLINASHSMKDVGPTEPHYRESWERAVNVQLYNDQVARMVMNGKSVDDILNWMRNTDAGRAYWGRLGPWQSRPVEQVYAIKAMVDTYLPEPTVAANRAEVARYTKGGEAQQVQADMVGSGGDAHTAANDLRQAALAGKARFENFDKLFPTKEEMPAVHGSSLDLAVGGPFSDMLKRGVNKIFNKLSDMPADKASRFPFFADRYQAHLRDIAPRWAEEYGDVKLIPTDLIDQIQKQARSRALADVKKYLFDTSASLDLASAGRLFVPFAGAIGDSYLKWGVIAREKGVIPPVLNIWKIWTAPDRAGLVQDEDGNVKRWDDKTQSYVWYQRNPKTGEEKKLDGHEPLQEYITFQLPVGVPGVGSNRTATGAVMPTYINKETFNTFLGLPTAGPLIAVPANQFELKNPKLADNWFIRKFVLPFGATSDVTKSFLPSNVRNTYNLATGEEQSRRGIAQAVLQTEYAKFALGQRDKPPTMDEVNQTADDIYGLQYMSQFLGVSSQFKSPYQPYLDYYHMLQQTDPENALGRFYSDMGDEYRMMTAAVSRNVAGLPASVESANAAKKYQDLIAKFPDLAPLIVGSEGAGEFNRAVYQAQLDAVLQPGSDQRMRQVLTLQESVEDAEKKYVWYKFGKLMDAIDADMKQRGLKNLQSKRAKDLAAAKQKFIDAHKFWTNPQGGKDVNPWFLDYSTTNAAQMTQRLTGMEQLVTDDRIGGRDEMKGLFDYLVARRQMKAEMDRRGFKTLSAKKATVLSNRWDEYVTGLKGSNLSFAALYNRWLVNDDLSADMA